MAIAVRELFKIIDNINTSYYVDANCGNHTFRIHSWNLHGLYSLNVRGQVIEKLLLNNFKKIYIMVYFKNEKSIHQRRNNNMVFELDLYNMNNDVYIELGRMVTKFINEPVIDKFVSFFKSKDVPLINRVIELDIKNINSLNFRKPIRIRKLEGDCFYIKPENMLHTSGSSDIDLIDTIYDKKIAFDLELCYMLFNQYFIKQNLKTNFENYSDELFEIGQDITNVNNKINSEYKDEKKLLSTFKNQDFIFMETISVVNSCEKVFELLSKFKELNFENQNKELIFERFQFIESLITKYDKHDKTNTKYNNLIFELEKYSNSKIVLTNKHAVKHKVSEMFYTGSTNRHLQFDFKSFKINIRLSKNNKLKFNKIKNTNMFFNLLEPLVTNVNFIDYIEKFAFSE